MKKSMIATCIALVAAGCAASHAGRETASTNPISFPLAQASSDTNLSLGKTSVFAVAVPDPVVWIDPMPGSNALLARADKEAPPLIPHGVADQLPITFEENVCIECHLPEDPADETPRIPASHLKAGKVMGNRYLCISCHVNLTTAPPLVRNMSK